MNEKKMLLNFSFVFVLLLVFVGASAAQVVISDVELNEDSLSPTATNFVRDVQRGDQFTVKVHLYSTEPLSDVQVSGEIRGYDHTDLIDDITSVFDMKANVTYVKKLSLSLPQRMGQDRYKLRIHVEDRDSNTYEQTYELEVDTARHSIVIQDVLLNPFDNVKAGSALLSTIRLKNYGEVTEEGIKMKFSIPALGVSASDYMDKLKSDESASSEELYLRIPACTKEGDYTWTAEVSYHDGEKTTSKSGSVHVIKGNYCPTATAKEENPETITSKTVISIATTSQTIDSSKGGVVYPVTVTNAGTTSKTYMLSVDSTGWADFQISPSNVMVLNPGQSGTAYVYVTPLKSTVEGEHMFSVTVKTGENVLKQIPMKAVVEGTPAKTTTTTTSKLKTFLEVALLVLLVLLVLLGIIVAFSRLKKGGKGEEEGEEAKTYY